MCNCSLGSQSCWLWPYLIDYTHYVMSCSAIVCRVITCVILYTPHNFKHWPISKSDVWNIHSLVSWIETWSRHWRTLGDFLTFCFRNKRAQSRYWCFRLNSYGQDWSWQNWPHIGCWGAVWIAAADVYRIQGEWMGNQRLHLFPIFQRSQGLHK